MLGKSTFERLFAIFAAGSKSLVINQQGLLQENIQLGMICSGIQQRIE